MHLKRGILQSTAEIDQMIHNIPQPRFEQFVAEQLIGDPNVEIRKGVAFVSCIQVIHYQICPRYHSVLKIYRMMTKSSQP